MQIWAEIWEHRSKQSWASVTIVLNSAPGDTFPRHFTGAGRFSCGLARQARGFSSTVVLCVCLPVTYPVTEQQDRSWDHLLHIRFLTLTPKNYLLRGRGLICKSRPRKFFPLEQFRTRANIRVGFFCCISSAIDPKPINKKFSNLVIRLHRFIPSKSANLVMQWRVVMDSIFCILTPEENLFSNIWTSTQNSISQLTVKNALKSRRIVCLL
jgi:hypothetical protein